MIKIAVLILLLIVAWMSLRSMEPRTLYYPDRIMIANPSVYWLAYDDLQLTDEDGTRIHGWFLPGAKPITILFCHGNAGNISHRLDKAMRLHSTGAGLLFFDYRGFGLSEGTPTEAGTYQDAEAAYRYLIETKRLKPEQIVFQGESLGCAVATEMAIRHPEAGGLILESPFTSTVAMAKRIFPWLPVKWIVRYRYDNLSKIPKIKMPLLIMHSPQDDIVPFEMGRALFAAAPEPKQFVELVGDHNEGYAESGDRYRRAVEDFLNKIRLHASGGFR
jgi:fermentation-respiration switch protein FrsA (DUF1100 family)